LSVLCPAKTSSATHGDGVRMERMPADGRKSRARVELTGRLSHACSIKVIS